MESPQVPSTLNLSVADPCWGSEVRPSGGLDQTRSGLSLDGKAGSQVPSFARSRVPPSLRPRHMG